MLKWVIILATCIACEECPVLYWYEDQTGYNVNAEELTKSGISVDRSGVDVSLAEIDRLVDEVEECLAKKWPGGKMSDEERWGARCHNRGFNLPISRECLTVKIAPDCTLNHDGTQELMPWLAPGSCEGKYDTDEEGPSEEWPCKWRAGIQDNHTIATGTSLYLLKDVLIRIATGCVGVREYPPLAECARPSTDPLSGLVDE